MGHRLPAYVGLGANVGDARATLRRAVGALAALPGVELRGVSGLYRSKPVGVTGQPDFLNAVVELAAPAGPHPAGGALALLAALKQLEQTFGRRQRQRWGPRELDLDLLLLGPHEIKVERPAGRWLQVPHVELGNRLFVLAPLSDLAPRLRPPGWAESIDAARRRQTQAEGWEAVRLVGRWDREARDWSPVAGSVGRADSVPELEVRDDIALVDPGHEEDVGPTPAVDGQVEGEELPPR
ncbi:hypothetical protein BH24CHL6_BH24CHL6_11890 [soil metagenome]